MINIVLIKILYFFVNTILFFVLKEEKKVLSKPIRARFKELLDQVSDTPP
jgi:hypothetical protein